MNKLTTSLAALFIGAATFHTAADAQTFNEGDLILGFQTPAGNMGTATNLEVDLGAATTFTLLAGTGQSLDLSNYLTLNDITTTYGTKPTALSFGVAGTQGVSNDEIYISEAGTTVPKESSNQSNIENIIDNIYTPTDTNGSGPTDGFTATSAVYSYTSVANANNSQPGTYGNTYQNTQALFNSSGTATLKLYDLMESASGTPAGTQFGTLSLTDTGTGESLIFTATGAVPEPSTYALMGAGLLGLLAFARWRGLTA